MTNLGVRFCLVLLSAVLMTLAFPHFSLWWLAFFGLVPVFWVLANSRSKLTAFLWAFVFGAVLTTGVAHWLYHALTVEFEKPPFTALYFLSLAVLVPYGLLFGLFGLVFRWLYRPGLFFAALAAPSAWLALEYAKQVTPVLIPWGNPGYVAMASPWFAQCADLFGVYGLCFVFVAANVLALEVFRQWRLHRGQGKGRAGFPSAAPALALLALAVALPLAYGAVRLPQVQNQMQACQEGPDSFLAVVTQASYSQKERWSGMGFFSRIKTYLDLSGLTKRGEGAPGKKVVVWPETVLNNARELTDDFYLGLMETIGPDTLLIAGGVRNPQQGKGAFNSALFISGQGRLMAYDKNILLPWSENAPGGQDLVGDYYDAPSQFLAGKTPNRIKAPGLDAGTFICFEAVYPWFVRKSVAKGAQILVNLSNDAWFNSTMPFAHLDAARLRAVENRRYLLRASNSGISAIVGPDGSILAQTRLNERAAIEHKVCPRDGKTLYTRLGDWPLWLAGVVLLVSVLRKEKKPIKALQTGEDA